MDNVLTTCHDLNVDNSKCKNRHTDFTIYFEVGGMIGNFQSGFNLTTLVGSLNWCNETGSSLIKTVDGGNEFKLNRKSNRIPLPNSFFSIKTVTNELIRLNFTYWDNFKDTENPKMFAFSFDDWNTQTIFKYGDRKEFYYMNNYYKLIVYHQPDKGIYIRFKFQHI